MTAEPRQIQTTCWCCNTVQRMGSVCPICGVYVPDKPRADLELVDCPGCGKPKPPECRCPYPQCDRPPDA